MKCAELAEAIQHLEGLFQIGACDAPQVIANLKSLLAGASALSVSQLSKKLAKVSGEKPGTAPIDVSGIPQLCEVLVSFLKSTGKPAVIKELQELSNSLGSLKRVNPEDLAAKSASPKQQSGSSRPAPAQRLDLVQMHLRLLEQSLGDDVGFTSAFRALEADTNMGTGEFVSLAKQFSFASTKSKSAALKKIWARHQALMTSRAKAAATAGRIAG
ncbi:MAG: hypothetical protein JSR78_03685 [Proteobacteria bacterium]|nr:hypothetical protein [Pseudomonadota bacterium]